MKRYFAILISLVLHYISSAQPLLTGPFSNPVPGEKFYLHNCDTTGVSRGSAGSGITWDLTHLSITGTDSIIFATTQSTLYNDTFPTADIASIYESGLSSDYFIADTSQLAIVGSGNTYATLYYSDPLSLLKYPMYYNTRKDDHFAFSQPDFSTYGHGYDSLIADARGTLLLPNGTFGNILRVHTIHWETDSFDYTAPPTVVTHRYDVYSWYQPGYHHPLVSMLYDTSYTGQEHLSQVYYSLTSYITTGLSVATPKGPAMTAFPNPAADHIAIAFTDIPSGPVDITLTNIVGQQIIVQQENSSLIRLNVASLPPGAYLLKAHTAGGDFVQRVYIRH